MNIEYIRELLLKKEQNITNELDNEKIANLKEILKNDDIFFKLDLVTAVNILAYLGIPEDKIEDAYYKLISPKNYLNTDKPYFSIEK